MKLKCQGFHKKITIDLNDVLEWKNPVWWRNGYWWTIIMKDGTKQDIFVPERVGIK